MRDKSHDEIMGRYYRERPAEAAAMFHALLLDGGQLGEWRIFFRHVRRAFFRRGVCVDFPTSVAYRYG